MVSIEIERPRAEVVGVEGPGKKRPRAKCSHNGGVAKELGGKHKWYEDIMKIIFERQQELYSHKKEAA